MDSNIPMYLVGGRHAHKADARHLLERLIAEQQRLITDAEVLQEILHRYTAIQRRDAIQPAFEALLGVVEEVLPVELDSVQRAREIVLGYPDLSARDALHLGVMARHGIRRILSFDRGFDRFPGIERIAAP